jgi:hypothetical protein
MRIASKRTHPKRNIEEERNPQRPIFLTEVLTADYADFHRLFKEILRAPWRKYI